MSKIDWSSASEMEMQAAEAPWPKEFGDLESLIQSLVERDHDYGTCVYAMSIAATAAMRYVASKLGASGFQGSCAGLDIIRRYRGLKHGFAIVDFGNAMYPQYLSEDYWWPASRVLIERREELADEARRLLAVTANAHPRVIDHWEWLASRSAPKPSPSIPQDIPR